MNEAGSRINIASEPNWDPPGRAAQREKNIGEVLDLVGPDRRRPGANIPVTFSNAFRAIGLGGAGSQLDAGTHPGWPLAICGDDPLRLPRPSRLTDGGRLVARWRRDLNG